MEDFQDAIMPDDFEGTPTEETGLDDSLDADFESGFDGEDNLNQDYEDSYEQPQEEQVSYEQPTLRIKYNHQERELSYDEAVELAQKGMNYDKGLERAAQEAKQQALDDFIAQQGYEWNGEQITTYDQYQKALEEQQLIEKYGNVPDEVIQELLENRKFREQIQEQQKEQQQKEYETSQFKEFAESFPDVNATDIPQEVWNKFESGVPLKYAYMEYERSLLHDIIKAQTTTQQIQQQNQINRAKAPIQGVTSYGSGEPEKSIDPFLEGFNSR